MSDRERNEITVELKYCERCGGLWLRDGGSLQVYCTSCQLQIAELPARKKPAMSVRLPIAPGVAFDYPDELEFLDDEESDETAAGGVA